MNGPTCKMCNHGTIERTKVYRMGNVVVAIGYLLLVLSVVGLLMASGAFLNSPRPEDFVFLGDLRAGLARDAQGCLGFSSLVVALFGWLLVRKKKVLKCDQCGVEVPASLSGMYDGST